MGQAASFRAYFTTNVTLTPNSHASPAQPRSASTASSSQAPKPKSRKDFTIGIVCALELEAKAVEALLVQRWSPEDYDIEPQDLNEYTLGRIGDFNVVIVRMKKMGKVSAAVAAANCHASFTEIKLALVVGICGGVPTSVDSDTERVLGDVVISTQLIEYDFNDGNGPNVNKPNTAIRGFLSKLQTRRTLSELQDATLDNLGSLQSQQKATYPGVKRDFLYESSYIHKHRDPQDCEEWSKTCGKADGSCDSARNANCEDLGCDPSRRVPRNRLQESGDNDVKLSIHFGQFASGDTVMKSGQHRDQLAKDRNIIAFEMEGAGVWEALPCVVVKAICDYSDSHKSKVWQDYAAFTAAACAAAFLDQWESNNA